MSISSMTGFAKQNGELIFDNLAFNWSFELKSVNGKGLDLKVKSPSWIGDISIQLKTILAKYFSRGSFSVYLDISTANSSQKVKINEDLLEQFTNIAIRIYDTHNDKVKKPSASEILNIRGIVEIEDDILGDESVDAFQKTLLDSFEEVCKSLRKSRRQEGEKTKIALKDILNKIEDVVSNIEKLAEDVPTKLKDKLRLQIASMLDEVNSVSEERLAQEIVLYVAKADIKEEIDRLKMHLKTADEMLNSFDAVGRKLDFLCQELNREANTTCSKSVDINITNFGMELKTFIEQFREQVQNIE